MTKPVTSYSVNCPHCGSRNVDTVKRIWILRGMILVARYGSLTLVGCRPCVETRLKREAVTNLFAGWWCVPWGLGTPFVVIQNLLAWLSPTTDDAIEKAFARVGIQAADVRLDHRGFTGEQLRMLDAAYCVLGQAMMADAHLDTHELELATRIVRQLTGNRIPAEEISEAILLADPSRVAFGKLSAEYRAALLQMAFQVAIADSRLTTSEIGYLESVAYGLGLPPDSVERLMAGARQQSSAAGRASAHEELARAFAILGVSPTTDVIAIKTAYRRRMLQYHPDMAGPDSGTKAQYHAKAQAINWAYQHVLTELGYRS